LWMPIHILCIDDGFPLTCSIGLVTCKQEIKN